jgi:hypothetical protein
MTESNNTNAPLKHAEPLQKRILQGAGIAAILIVLLLSLGERSNTPGVQWMFLPLIFVPAV